jgi:predicted amidohydrolase YtcJ
MPPAPVRPHAGVAGAAGAAGLVLRDVRLDGRPVDVLVRDGQVARIADRIAPPAAAEVVDGNGGALLPGLWDHHVHLLALAAAAASVAAGPPAVTDAAGLARALGAADRALAPGRWLRAVGYHESVAGPLDRDALDRLVPGRPARVQHRTGALWLLNGAGVAAARLDDASPHPGVERDAEGRATGRVYGADRWLRDRLGPADPPDLAAVGARLARLGVVGVTDATPYDRADDLAPLAAAAASGALPQHVVATGGPALAGLVPPAPLAVGPVKLVVADHRLPDPDDLAGWIRTAHRHDRPVAVHCVTRVALVLALVAWDAAGSRPGDRVEHGAVVPPDLRDGVARLGLTVVTQPHFVAERGDQYLADVEPDDLPYLYPCQSLLDAGIPVAAGSDAPYGDADPWRSIAAAVARRTPSGAVVAPGERVDPRQALALWLGPPDRPGGPPRRVREGGPADLCLLRLPLEAALSEPDPSVVAATVIAGRLHPD